MFLNVNFELFALLLQRPILSGELIFEYEILLTILELNIILSINFPECLQSIKYVFGEFVCSGEELITDFGLAHVGLEFRHHYRP
jgi:hypothetical protein